MCEDSVDHEDENDNGDDDYDDDFDDSDYSDDDIIIQELPRQLGLRPQKFFGVQRKTLELGLQGTARFNHHHKIENFGIIFCPRDLE